MRLTIRAEIGAFAVLALGFGARTAMADYPPSYASGCATGACAAPARPACGPCANLSAKLSESMMLKRYGTPCCPPRLSTGACYGYFPTQWNSWEAACPGWGAGLNQTGASVHPQPAPLPQAPQPQPAAPMKSPTPAKEVTPQPKSVTPPPVDAPKLPLSRAPTPVVPSPLLERGLILPPVPDIPTSTAPRF